VCCAPKWMFTQYIVLTKHYFSSVWEQVKISNSATHRSTASFSLCHPVVGAPKFHLYLRTKIDLLLRSADLPFFGDPVPSSNGCRCPQSDKPGAQCPCLTPQRHVPRSCRSVVVWKKSRPEIATQQWLEPRRRG
jgi:hypothetical protein